MKAIIYERYGSPDVLQLREIEKPTLKENEVLVKVEAASINVSDYYLLKGEPLFLRLAAGVRKPREKILGADIAGWVEAVGSGVTQFEVGDAVFGDISECGRGGYAEYVSVPEDVLVLKPATLSFEAVAAVPMAAITALQGLRDAGEIGRRQTVLIYGASGGVGSFAVQLAKSFGVEVTAVCSTTKMAMVRSMGADHVIDYTQEDFTQNGERYDLILGVNGYRSLSDYKRALTSQGVYVCVGGTMPQIFQAMLLGPLLSLNGSQKMGSMGVAKPNQKDLTLVRDLLATGKVVPIIDACYPLAETRKAMWYFSEGHTKGKVIIKIAERDC